MQNLTVDHRCGGQVRAIRISEEDIAEGQLRFSSKQPSSHSPLPPTPTLLATLGEEEVFLAQLSSRAMLLNVEFQAKVLDVVNGHAAPPRNDDGRSTVEVDAAAAMSNQVMAASSRGHFLTGSVSTLPREASKVLCRFDCGEGSVVVHTAPPKGVARMREKMLENAPPHPQGRWPLSANILDPVRVSIVCCGSDQVMQVARWFTEGEAETGLVVCRLKNSFAAACDIAASGGYRDLKLFVLFEGAGGFRIVGEIQIHDMELYLLKLKVVWCCWLRKQCDECLADPIFLFGV